LARDIHALEDATVADDTYRLANFGKAVASNCRELLPEATSLRLA
jgi:hypothetical protein